MARDGAEDVRLMSPMRHIAAGQGFGGAPGLPEHKPVVAAQVAKCLVGGPDFGFSQPDNDRDLARPVDGKRRRSPIGRQR